MKLIKKRLTPVEGGVFEDHVRNDDVIRKFLKSWSIDLTFNEYDPLIDSSDILPKNWRQIVTDISKHYNSYDGFLIIHGTDTMAYTSSMLAFALENLGKPVVLTGSQNPIFDPGTDATINVINALKIAAGEGKIHEVSIVFSNSIIRGCRATKTSAHQDDGFKSPAHILLGQIDGDAIKFNVVKRPWKSGGKFNATKLNFDTKSQVVVIKLFPAFDPDILRFFADKDLFYNPSDDSEETDRAVLAERLEKCLESSEEDNNNVGQYKEKIRDLITSLTKEKTEMVKGIVIEAYGVGNSPSSDPFKDAIQELVQAGIVVVVTSQVLHAKVALKDYETSNAFVDKGARSGFDMTTEAAVTKLYYLFNKGLNADEVKSQIGSDIRGEVNDNVKTKLPLISINTN